jgi:hypothetical protein
VTNKEMKFDLSFQSTDAMLRKAKAVELDQFHSLVVERGDQLGPWAELAVAYARMPEQYRGLRPGNHPKWTAIQQALIHGEISGKSYQSTFGVFPLSRIGSTDQEVEIWDQWCLRFKLAAESSGFPKSFASALTGAMGELQDNVPLHSENVESGLVAFQGGAGIFELVVSDQGIGVLASLQKNPEYQHLAHSGDALKVAVADGGSRFGKDSGHGYGIGQLYRALASVDGDIRFRSGDHAFELSGSGPNSSLSPLLAQKWELPGLTISVTCRTHSMGG